MTITRIPLVEHNTNEYIAFEYEVGLDEYTDKVEEFLNSDLLDERNSSQVLDDVMENDAVAEQLLTFIVEDAEAKIVEPKKNKDEIIASKIKDNQDKLKDDMAKKNFIVLRQTMGVIQKDLSSKRVILVLKSIKKSKFPKGTQDMDKMDSAVDTLYSTSNDIEASMNAITDKLNALNKVDNNYDMIQGKIIKFNDRYKGIVKTNNRITSLLAKKNEITSTEFVKATNAINANLKTLSIPTQDTSRSSKSW